MKYLFTFDDFAVAFIAALGYGFGYDVAIMLGWPMPACIIACFAVGMGCEFLMSKIVFSKTVQIHTFIRLFILILVFFIFLIAQYVALTYMDESMEIYVAFQLAYVIGLPIIGFFFNLCIRGYQIQKIKERYGDGSQGYVFDLKDEDIEAFNRPNRRITGEYDKARAVKTKTGVYVGEKAGGVINYLGIPYAVPPVGDLRWKAPEPLSPSEDVFEAKHFGASAIQVEHNGLILKHHRQSEDCLTLNVSVSAKNTEAGKPVLVSFHHGDFTYGGSADPLSYGDRFVKAHPDTIFVSFNYRLGIFGFIDFSEIPGGQDYPDAPNLGLLDQIAALKWIRDNIAAFGGDPGQITVMGFEDGATSVSLLSLSEAAKGLFQKAFVFVGSPISAYDTPEPARALAGALLKETRAASMAELSRLDTQTLKAAADKLWPRMCGPTRDGKHVPADPYRACLEGAASGIEFIIGIPRAERMVYRSFIGEKNYREAVSAAMGEIEKNADDALSDAIRQYLKTHGDDPSDTFEAKAELIERWIALYAYRYAAKLSEGGSPVHLMYWNRTPLIDKLGSGTVDAEAEFLGNGEALRAYGNVMDKDMSDTLQTFLYKFIKGDDLKLYRNEIRGVDALTWEAFPKALIVSDDAMGCDTIEDKITDVIAPPETP